MNLDQFQTWLAQNPQRWFSIEDPYGDSHDYMHPTPSFEMPAIYAEFLKRFGPMKVGDWNVLIDTKEVGRIVNFIRSFEGYDEEHDNRVVPFCSQSSNDWYYCFNGDRIVEFDALEPSLINDTYKETFEDFLDWLVTEVAKEGSGERL